jgi:hypothetical protein
MSAGAAAAIGAADGKPTRPVGEGLLLKGRPQRAFATMGASRT